MKQLTFSIKDNKTGIYHRPMYLPHPQQAVRQFEQIVNDPQSTINRYPEDYQLVQLGEFDDETGITLTLDTPEFIAHGYSLLKKDLGGTKID